MDFIAARAASRGVPVTVALSPGVAAGGVALGTHGAIRRWLARPGVTFLPDVGSEGAAAASGADFLLSASSRDLAKIWPYEEQWSFRAALGYAVAEEIASSPYEERYDLQPTWDGHVSALVLEKR